MNAETTPSISAIHAGFQRFLLESLQRHGIGPFLGFIMNHRASHYRFVQEFLITGLKDPNNEANLLDQVLKASPLEYVQREERAIGLLREIPIIAEERNE